MLILALAVAWPVTGAAATAADYLKEAEAYVSKGEYNAAVIQLKNALLLEPVNPQARLLLGKAYLETGDGASAEKEISYARTSGMDRTEWLVPLGRAYLLQGKADDLLRDIDVDDSFSPALRAGIHQLRGDAHLIKKQTELASSDYTNALALQPDNTDALMGMARIAYINTDSDKALEYIEQILGHDPDNAPAWTMKGEILRLSNKYQEALTAFQRALDAKPDDVSARMGKATTLISMGEPDQALLDIDLVQARYPNLYLGHYLEALARYQLKQPEQAQESIQTALKLAPDHPHSQLLAGVIAYQQGQLNQTEQNLRKYLKRDPGNLYARKLLAATLMKLKQPGKTIEILEPGLSGAEGDAQYLALLGSAYIAQGDSVKGLEYLDSAVKVNPDVANLHTLFAIGQLASGDVDQAVTELNTAVELGQGLLQADLLLVMANLQKKDFDSALAAADALLEKMPNNPIPHNLRGAALLGKGDQQAAKKAYQDALGVQSDFIPAHLNLAQLDLLAQDTAAAERRYRKVLDYDANNLKALLALAALAGRDGRPDQAGQWLKQAYKNHPKLVLPMLQLAVHYLQNNDIQRALDLATEAAVVQPRSPVVLKTLAQVQLTGGNDEEALATLRLLVEVSPESPEAHYLLARVQAKLKSTDAATRNLQQAVKLQPDYPAAQLALGRLYIIDKDYDAATGIAGDLRTAHPDTPYGDELTGDIHAARQENTQAAEAYALAYGKAASAYLAQRLYQTRIRLGKTESAHQALSQWLADHPEDTATRAQLAMALQLAGQRQQAIEEYLKILEYDADNVTALNNVAWLYQEEGKAQKA